MSKLISQVSAPPSGKIAYQSYTITHGIESFKVLVPLTKVKTFETEFKALKGKKTNILDLLESVGGKVRD